MSPAEHSNTIKFRPGFRSNGNGVEGIIEWEWNGWRSSAVRWLS
jgi:hypothetical protein